MPIQWRHDAPPAHTLPDLTLRRLKASEIFHGTITCIKACSVITHFYGARTLPCLGDECPGCALGREKRRECYLSLERQGTHAHGILGITMGAERNLADQAPNWNNLRGLVITARRKGKKENGRVNIDVHEMQIDTHRLPDAPDMIRHMFRIWGLDTETITEDHPLFAYQRELILQLDQDHGARPRAAK